MSVLDIAGKSWAAGLLWRPRSHRASEARSARRFHCPLVVRVGRQTGFAEADDGEGAVSLAAALAAHLGTADWIAVLQSDDGSAVAVVRREGGEFPVDGDEVVSGRRSALEAVARAREAGAAVHAMSALGIADATPIDAGLLPVTDGMELVAAPRPRRIARIATVAVAASVLAVAAAGGFHWQALKGFIADEEVAAAAPVPPAEVEVQIAGAALIEACDHALTARPAVMPAWRTDRIECTASLQDPGILDEWPQFRHRPVMVVQWSLKAGHDPEISRRLMEEQAARAWQLSSVVGTTAWSLVELAPVLVEWSGTPGPSFLALREEIDRSAGPWATSLAFRRASGEPWSVVLAGPGPLSRAHAALAGIDGLEVTRLVQAGGSEWRIDGRELTPRRLLEEAVRRISAPLSHDTKENADGSV